MAVDLQNLCHTGLGEIEITHSRWLRPNEFVALDANNQPIGGGKLGIADVPDGVAAIVLSTLDYQVFKGQK